MSEQYRKPHWHRCIGCSNTWAHYRDGACDEPEQCNECRSAMVQCSECSHVHKRSRMHKFSELMGCYECPNCLEDYLS